MNKKSRQIKKGTHSEGYIDFAQIHRDSLIEVEQDLQEEDNTFITGSCKQDKELILLNDSQEQEIFEEIILTEEE